jgi:hypothetical protein
MMAIVNSYRYSKKLYVIGQSATKPLSPLYPEVIDQRVSECKDMGKAQRLNGGRPEKISNLL